MINVSDVFLLLASLYEFPVSKTFIKSLYNSHKNFPFLFTSNSHDLESKLNSEEQRKLQELRRLVKNLNLTDIGDTLKRKHIKFLSYSEKEYSEKLKAINDPPFGLFYKGNIELLNYKKSVAIVGTRSATTYGLNIAKKIASLLAKENVTIISGLASGIDSSAHIGGIEGGKTIAVLGTGPDIIFPSENKELHLKILEKNNLIISEYPPKTPGTPWNFPQRNRIISALSDAVIIIEGDIQSGAMITARFAIKQGKPLFALPGPIDLSTSNGPNLLIKSGVAELLTSVNDVLEKIGEPKQVKLDLKDSTKKDLEELNERQKTIYKFFSTQTKSFDCLLKETNLNIQELIRELSMLELKGIIEKTPDGGYIRC